VKKLNRRQFVQTTAAAGAAAAGLPKTLFGQAPTMMTPKSVKPVVVSSNNGHKFKNGGSKTCVETAFAMITGGSDVLDALIAGVNIVELDPEDSSVGYGGLPERRRRRATRLVLHARPEETRRRRRRHRGRAHAVESRAARDDETDHHLLVGKGAQDFARSMGLKVEDDLNTEKVAQGVARMEAADRSAALPVAEGSTGGVSPRRRWT
jgi:N4-(beta-N-acetylglucosaminyl)-L-asparaginase